MKTIKVIELLNKIANGEKPPKKVKWGGIFIYDDKINDYKTDDEYYRTYLLECINVNKKDLNDEIEIIEDTEKDEKKIEKLPLKTPCILPNRTDTEISHIPDNLELTVKINEIIDYINDNGNHIPRID